MSSISAIDKLHDAELMTIYIDRIQHRIMLDFRASDGSAHKLTFEGVIASRGVDLVLQNVVSRILLSSDGSLSDDELLHSVRWASQRVDTGPLIAPTTATEWLSRIKNKEWNLFVLEPSCGCEMVVIFKNLLCSTSSPSGT